MIDGMQMIGGMKIIVTPDQMVEKLLMPLGDWAYEVLTPAMIEEHDKWSREFFGYTVVGMWNMVEDGQAIIIQSQNVVYVNPRTYEQLKILMPEYATRQRTPMHRVK